MSKVKFKKPNFDTLTPSSAEKVTSKLLGYLDEVNPDAKQYVEYLLSSDRHADINSKVDTSKLEKLDAKILEVLKKIEENMIDEQDTSIKYKDRASEAGVGFWLGNDFWETETAGADNESNTDLFAFRRPKTLTERRKRIEERRRKRAERRKRSSGRLNRSSNKEPKANEPKTRASETKAKETKTGTRVASEAKPETKVSKKSSKNISKEISKASKTNFVKKALGIGVKSAKLAAKFATKAVAFPVAVALSAYDAATGYKNASENLGVKESELTTTNKISSAAGSVLSGDRKSVV